MANKSTVWYREGCKAYYTTFKGKQVELVKGPKDEPEGPTYVAAVKALAKLTCGTEPGLTFAEVIRRYLLQLGPPLEPSTVKLAKTRLNLASRGLGNMLASHLTLADAQKWIKEQRTSKGWGDATVFSTVTWMRACTSWAVETKEMLHNPLQSLEVPSMPSRGVECVLSAAQERRVLETAKRGTLDLVTVLSDTGARPGELRIAEAKHFNPDIPAIVIPAKHRTRGKSHKTGRHKNDRVIYLPPRSAAIVHRLCQKYASGPIFRSNYAGRRLPNGGKVTGWTENSICLAMERLRETANVPDLISYSFRHTFAVNKLRKGVPIAALAEIMGTSIEMIIHHYGHLSKQHDYLYGLVCGDGTLNVEG